MANGYYGDWAVTLPNMNERPSSALQNYIRNRINSQALLSRLNQQALTRQQLQEWRNSQILSDYDKPHSTGIIDIDKRFNQIYQQKMKEYEELAKTMSTTQQTE